jgi:hypothetical protein
MCAACTDYDIRRSGTAVTTRNHRTVLVVRDHPRSGTSVTEPTQQQWCGISHINVLIALIRP